MTKLILTMAAGSALLLVSCEPIPIDGRPRPYADRHQHQPSPYDRDSERRYDQDDDRQYNQDGDRRYDEEAPRPPTRDQYPVAQRTSNPNHVISPYSPYNVINVEGFRSGQLAKDPSNQKVFRIP